MCSIKPLHLLLDHFVSLMVKTVVRAVLMADASVRSRSGFTAEVNLYVSELSRRFPHLRRCQLRLSECHAENQLKFTVSSFPIYYAIPLS
jgi:hypothetical protein